MKEIILTGDINGDGLADLLAICTTSPDVVAFVGLPDAGFSDHAYPLSSTSGGTGLTASSAVLTDVNGDGLADVVLSLQGDAGFATLLSQPDGGFAPAMFWSNGLAAGRLVTADINGDGTADLAFTAGTTGYVLFGWGDGGFSAPVTAEAQAYPGGWWPDRVAVGDLNGDRVADVVFMSSVYGQGRARFYNRDGGFTPGPDFQLANDVGDLALGQRDGDAFADLVMVFDAHQPSTAPVLATWRGAGDGSFAPASTPSGGLGSPGLIAVADLNGDGVLDVVVPGGNSGLVSLFPGTASGTLGPGAAFFTSVAPTQAVVGDFDHDGRADIAVIGSATNSIAIYYGH